MRLRRTRSGHGTGPARAVLTGALLAAAVSCADSVGPTSYTATARLSVSTPAGAPAAAATVFAKANQVAFRVFDVGSPRPFVQGRAPLDPDLSRTVDIRFTTPGRSVRIELDILRDDDPLFVGSVTVSLGDENRTEATIDVEAVPHSLTVAPDSALTLGRLDETLRLSGAVLYATGDTLADEGMTWSSLDTAVVKVDADGVVTAVGNGSTQVEGTAMGLTEAVPVTVKVIVVELALSAEVLTFDRLGDEATISAKPFDREGRVIPGVAIRWATSDPAVVAVDEGGRVTAVGNGRANVTAATDSAAGSVAVRVAQRDVLAATVLEELDRLTGLLALGVAQLADEVAVTSRDPVRIRASLGRFTQDDSEPYWNEVHRVRVLARDAWDLLAEISPDATVTREGAILKYVEGMTHKALGETFCAVSYDGGPIETRGSALERAVASFDEALSVAAASGADEWGLAAHGGIAQASLGLGDWSRAIGSTQQVPTDFEEAARFDEGWPNPIWAESWERPELGAWGSLAERLGPPGGEGDPRVPYTVCGEWNDTLPVPKPELGVARTGACDGAGSGDFIGADGTTAHYRQDKYSSPTDGIVRVSGVEMRLIEAEFLLVNGNVIASVALVNQARSHAGLAPLPLTEYAGFLDFPYEVPAYDGWSILDQERYAALWLTGRRLFDLARWRHPFVEEGGDLLGPVYPTRSAARPRTSCMPIPASACPFCRG